MLTLSALKNAKPASKTYRLSDFGGLFVLINPSGSKLWRWKYRRPGSGKENPLAFGAFPAVTIQEARECREDARRLLSRGIDPGLERRIQRLAKAQSAAST